MSVENLVNNELTLNLRQQTLLSNFVIRPIIKTI